MKLGSCPDIFQISLGIRREIMRILRFPLFFRTQMDLFRRSEGVGRFPVPLEIADNLPDAMVTKSGDFDEKNISFGSRKKKYFQILRFSEVTLDLTTTYKVADLSILCVPN